MLYIFISVIIVLLLVIYALYIRLENKKINETLAAEKDARAEEVYKNETKDNEKIIDNLTTDNSISIVQQLTEKGKRRTQKN